MPYRLRLLFAFTVNALFNRPVVYLNYFDELIGKRINRLVLWGFYFSFFGLYAVLFKLGSVHWRARGRSVWREMAKPAPDRVEELRFQV
jgi:hypothetical protein